MVRRISSSLRGGSVPKGVPGIGWRILIGIDFISISYRLNAISTLSSHVSPIPMIPPEQTARPAFLARRITSSLSSYVCVVQMFGKFLLDVSIFA